MTRQTITAQPGPQAQFLASPASIAVYGGGAGGGKTFALLLEILRHYHNPEFRAVIFRREVPQITNPGGLWDEARNLYTPLGASFREKPTLDIRFPSGLKLKCGHLQLERDKYNWQGAQFAFLGLDEGTHFSEGQFWYLVSRLRSMSGVPGYARITCNPDPDSWLAELLEWFIEQDENSPRYGLPIPERAGVLRWFVKENDRIIWADSREELVAADSTRHPKSLTFIPSTVYDNKILLEKDPAYLSNLKAQDRVTRAQLLDGNWKIKASAGELFKKEWFEIVDAAPAKVKVRIRYWDRAATEPHAQNKNPDWTAGILVSRDEHGVFYVEDMVRLRKTPLGVQTVIETTASQDEKTTIVGIEQDPGQAGVSEAQAYVRLLAGHIVKLFPARQDKVTRAKPVSAQAEARNIKLVRGRWNKAFLDELEPFPTEGVKDDQVDALSGAVNAICDKKNSLPKVWSA